MAQAAVQLGLSVGRGETTHVGRGSKWASPFLHADGSELECVVAYERRLAQRPALLRDVKELEGMTLSCECKQGTPCHAWVLSSLVKEDVMRGGFPCLRTK